MQDITVEEQLVTFVRHVNERGEAKTVFNGTKALDSPQGPNAEAITKTLLEPLANCNLPITCMSSFVSDGASVMIGKRFGVAARLKNLQPCLNPFPFLAPGLNRFFIAIHSLEKFS